MENFIYLRSGYNAYEKGLLHALLEGEGLRYRTEVRGAGDFIKVYFGQSIFAEDFYILSQDLERAQELVAGFSLSDAEKEVVLLEELEKRALDFTEEESQADREEDDVP